MQPPTSPTDPGGQAHSPNYHIGNVTAYTRPEGAVTANLPIGDQNTTHSLEEARARVVTLLAQSTIKPKTFAIMSSQNLSSASQPNIPPKPQNARGRTTSPTTSTARSPTQPQNAGKVAAPTASSATSSNASRKPQNVGIATSSNNTSSNATITPQNAGAAATSTTSTTAAVPVERTLMRYTAKFASSWDVYARGQERLDITKILQACNINPPSWTCMTRSQADKSLARITLTREHLRYVDDYEAVHAKSLVMMDERALIPDMDAFGIIELRPSGKKGADGRFVVAERWDSPTFLKDMVALFEDLKPAGIEIAEAYSQPLLLLRFDGITVNDAVRRARMNDLHVDYRTPPSTVTGFLEVTAKPNNAMKVHSVRMKAMQQLPERLGEVRYGLETSGPGYFRVVVAFARNNTQEHAFVEEVGGCTVRFTFDGEVHKKKDDDKAVEVLVRETLEGIQGKLEEPTGVVKRQRAPDVRDSDAVRRATERGTVDTNMDGTTAAGAAAASRDAVAVTDDDDDDELTKQRETKKAEATKLVDKAKKPIRTLLSVVKRCGTNDETMQSCVKILIGMMPKDEERVDVFVKAIGEVRSPGQLVRKLSEHGFVVPAELTLNWSSLLSTPQEAVPVKALNIQRQPPRQSRTSQPTEAPRNQTKSSDPAKRTDSVARQRGGSRKR